MLDLSALSSALHMLGSSWEPWLYLVPGMLLSLAIHMIPGLHTSMVLAICLPFIPYMDFLQALIFMTAMYSGALFGVAIPAIMLNIPGGASAVATTFDGFPMAQQGKHNEALGLALAASCIGQCISYVVLLALVEPIANFALKLGPPEMLVVSIWGLTLIARMSGKHLFRGLLAGVFGLLIGTVGMSAQGAARGTMGIPELLDGVPLVAAIVGLFAAAELFSLLGREYIVADRTSRDVNIKRIWSGARETFRHPGTNLRGGLLGTFIGTLPGGHAIANLLSYSEARRAAKDPEKFGTGDPRGIIAAESANASSEGGSMATLLALGIPTGGVTAVMLIAFGMHNITGGPTFMRDHKDIVYSVILAGIAQAFFLAILGFGFIFLVSFVVKIRLRTMVPIILALAILGSYALSLNMVGPVAVAVFSILGWIMHRFDYPVSATVVGILLGRMTEGSLLRSYQMSGGDWNFIFTRPIALVLLALLVISLAGPSLRALIGRRLHATRT
jgi:putative tricarboxylic transport membrane protein